MWDIEYQKIDESFLKEELDELMSSIPERTEYSIRHRYQLDETYKEIGDSWKISPERTRQIISKGLRQLRNPLKNKILREFLYLYPAVDSD